MKFFFLTVPYMDMTFRDFFEISERDLKTHLKENTFFDKKHIISTKIMPYFSDRNQIRDIITSPKTKKSNRTIKMPKFLCDEMQNYLNMMYDIQPDDRIFAITKSFQHHEMDRGSKIASVKRIRIHDLRHSHISLLIEMEFSTVAIADRVGDESIEITYHYAHLFPSKQLEMMEKFDFERRDENVGFRSRTIGFRVSPEEKN